MQLRSAPPSASLSSGRACTPITSRWLRPRQEPQHRVRLLAADDASLDTGLPPGYVMVLDGEATVVGRDYTLRLTAGSVLATDGREPLRLRPNPLAAAQLLCLWPDPATLDPAADGRAAERGVLAIVHEPGSRVADLMQRLAHTLAHTGTASLDGARPTQFWIGAVLAAQGEYAEAIARCHGRSYLRRRELFVRLSRARALLAAGDGDSGDVARLAAVARLSTSHFVRLFHQVFGEPPHRYRNRRRMELAHRLITQTDMPVHEVMWRTGFDSHSCFARSFRQHFGVSATTLRAREAPAAAAGAAA